MSWNSRERVDLRSASSEGLRVDCQCSKYSIRMRMLDW